MTAIGYAAPFLTIATVYAISFVLRHVRATQQKRRLERDAAQTRDDIVATLKLRLPSGAQFVTLEHQIYFRDERNRAAAQDVFATNGFDLKTTETYEKQTRFWLLAVRSTLIERVPEELQRVVAFAESYGGRYQRCDPQL